MKNLCTETWFIVPSPDILCTNQDQGACVCCVGGAEGELTRILVSCDMVKNLFPTIEIDFMQLSKRYSPEISNFSKHFRQKCLKRAIPSLIIGGFFASNRS